MNPSLFSNSFITIVIFIFILTPTVFSSTNTISYSDHCSSFAPEAIPTSRKFIRYSFLDPATSHYTGGQNILGPDPPSQRYIYFTTSNYLFKTETLDTYKIHAQLTFASSNMYRVRSNDSRFYRPLMFNLDGFWSVSTNKLCMVGSARWFSENGKPLNLNAVLKFNFATFISLNNSLVSGILESLASVHDSDYFEPISMIGFPRVDESKYTYSLVSNEECGEGVNGNFTREHSVASMQSLNLCQSFPNRFKTYKLENLESGHPPSLPFSSSFLSLIAIQCSSHEKKLRFLIEFQDRRSSRSFQSFNPNITLIGDGTWNGTKNELCIIACHILNRTDPFGSTHVGDCSVRLTLWLPTIRSIKNSHTHEGQIWSTKKAGDDGHFEPIIFHSFDHSLENYATKYEFTKLENLKRVCPRSKVSKWGRSKYPSSYNGDLGFRMSFQYGRIITWGSAIPIFVGNQFYKSYKPVPFHAATPSPVPTYTGPMNISYEIMLDAIVNSTLEPERGIPKLSVSDNGKVEISAEGFYDSDTGKLCMVGCRSLPSNYKNSRNESFDCELVVRFRFVRNKGRFIMKGSIESLRDKKDVLYIDRVTAISQSYTKIEARESIWRMDLEIIMDLISVTLSCLFIVLQLFHVKKNPELIPLVSVLMMVILTLGYMIPLVLNFEAMFSKTRFFQNISLGGNDEWIEVNEVIVRIVTMVAFILQFRLLQLTWSAKLGSENNGNGKSHWYHEIRTLIVCLPIYIIGGLIMLLESWKNDEYITTSQRSIWGDLRSYAGLTLDGFLVPQIVSNIFQISKGNGLYCLFYVGNTFVRLLPHVYDLYRGQKGISRKFDRFYLYANPRADFYSPFWDVFIAFGVVGFAMIIFLQQRFGGRFMLPKSFQESIEYDMVPVVNNK